MKNISVVLFSGGTGGHVIPAVNFGNYLINHGYKCLLFLDKRGMKYASKFKGKVIKINSSHFSGNIFFITKSILFLLYGLIQSIYYLFLIRPSHCIAFGGYASFMPLVVTIILRILRISTIHLHEQNSIIGKVNLFFLPFSKNIFLNLSNIKNLHPRFTKKICHVGLPNDEKIVFKKRKTEINKEKKIKIFIYGGSQGSINLNNGFLRLIKKLPENFLKNLFIVVQSPNNKIPIIESELKNFGIEYKLKNYFDDIYKVLHSCDIVVSRSGAGAINNIIISQIPSILVPLPHSVYNHQYVNAKFLFDKNAAQLIEEKHLNTNTTYSKFKELIENTDKRIMLIKNLQSIKILDANNLMMTKIFK